MAGVLKEIVKKFKLKQIALLMLLISLLLTFLPKEIAVSLGIENFRIQWQTKISLMLIFSGCFSFLLFITWMCKKLYGCIYSAERIGKNYLRHQISSDEMAFLISKFYDKEYNRFSQSAFIELYDGRSTGLTYRHVIYRSSNVCYFDKVAYSLQPWAYRYLNKSLQNGGIKLLPDGRFSYNLR